MNSLAKFFFFFFFSFSAWGSTPSDSAKFSILTAGSGKEIYKVYGHTAIRFQDQGRDLVYNYGMFDFDTPHFVWRFLQGENHYLLGREPFARFNQRYSMGGEKVTQQTLNLTSEELKVLFAALENNAQPENRAYLYNVFYDNCATRVYKILEACLDGGVVWHFDFPEASFRSLIHEYNSTMPFSQMGIDLVFGTKADKIVTDKEQLFLPEKLMSAFAKAHKKNGDALISETTVLLPGRAIHNKRESLIFHLVWGLMLLLAVYVRFIKKKWLRFWRITLYTLLGLISTVVCFIAFFSIHPTVFPNLNLIWINPLWLFFALLFMVRKSPQPFFQKLLNVWACLIGLFFITGLFGMFYLHYGLIYILPGIILLSYKRVA